MRTNQGKRSLLRRLGAASAGLMLVPVFAGNASAFIGNATIGVQAPNPVVAGGTATYSVQVQNTALILPSHFGVTAVSGAPGLSVTASGCVTINARTTGTLLPVQIATTAATTRGATTITLTVTEYMWPLGCGFLPLRTKTFTTTLNVVGTQSISFDGLPGRTYGEGPIDLGATASSGLPVTYGTTGPCTVTGSSLSITGIGLCSVTASQAGNASWAAATPVTQIFNIDQAGLTITVNASSKAYGQPNPAFGVSYSGFVNGDDSLDLAGTLSFATAADASSAAGDYPVTASGLTNPNYSMTWAPGTLSIGKATLTVTGVDASKTAGALNPALSAGYSDFVNGDTVDDLTAPATCTTTALTASPVGNYPISCSGAASDNYGFSYVDGTLSVGLGELDHIVISPNFSTISAGSTQAYTAEGFDSYGNSLGDVTAATTFSSATANCTGADCGSTVATFHTITATNGAMTDTATLSVVPGAFDHIVISPALATVESGVTQAYTVEAFDPDGNSIGDVTFLTTFTIGADNCAGAFCGSSAAGDHTITARFGELSDTAVLHVNAVAPTIAPTAAPTESIAGETAEPTEIIAGETSEPGQTTTPPPTNTDGNSPTNDSLPLLMILIAFAFGAIGLLAVQAQGRAIRR
jgi:hypothetical protein